MLAYLNVLRSRGLNLCFSGTPPGSLSFCVITHNRTKEKLAFTGVISSSDLYTGGKKATPGYRSCLIISLPLLSNLFPVAILLWHQFNLLVNTCSTEEQLFSRVIMLFTEALLNPTAQTPVVKVSETSKQVVALPVQYSATWLDSALCKMRHYVESALNRTTAICLLYACACMLSHTAPPALKLEESLLLS